MSISNGIDNIEEKIWLVKWVNALEEMKNSEVKEKLEPRNEVSEFLNNQALVPVWKHNMAGGR